jgi:hypothetical protein
LRRGQEAYLAYANSDGAVQGSTAEYAWRKQRLVYETKMKNQMSESSNHEDNRKTQREDGAPYRRSGIQPIRAKSHRRQDFSAQNQKDHGAAGTAANAIVGGGTVQESEERGKESESRARDKRICMSECTSFQKRDNLSQEFKYVCSSLSLDASILPRANKLKTQHNEIAEVPAAQKARK